MLAIAGLMLRIAVAMAAYTLIGVGIGALIRNQVIALGVVIGYFYLVETMLLLIPGVKIIYPILPGGATSALTNFSYLADATAAELGGGAIQLLPPALGALVLAAYAIAATGVSIAVPLRRDVT